jgi:acetoacetyl-CoA reductase/3-oxoacyl-[acyl-carrier protein] reductase
VVRLVAFVTGSGRGIGKEVALEFARRGLSVVTNSMRRADEAEATAEEARGLGVRAIAIPGDMGDLASIKKAFAVIDETFGRLDVLVCCAGVNRDGPASEITEADWDVVLDTNLKGPFFCAQAAAPLMQKAGAGSIVFIAARTAHRPRARGAGYCASKAGLVMLAKCLAIEFAPVIRVNSVSPGTTDTEEVRERHGLDTPEGMRRMVDSIPLQRISSRTELARHVAHVALDASFMTGADTVVDGGRNLVW